MGGEEIDDFGGVAGGGEEVDVANNFLGAAEAAGGVAAGDVGVAAQMVEDRLGGGEGVAEEMARGELAAEVDAFANFGLGFFAEAVEDGDFAVFAGLLELFDGFDGEFVVEGFDFFGAEAGNAEHGDEAGRDGGFEVVVVLELPVWTSSQTFSWMLSPTPLRRVSESGQKIVGSGAVAASMARAALM